MSTQVRDVGTGYEVATLDKLGKRRGLPSGRVVVAGPGLEALLAEVERQADQLRIKLGVNQPPRRPVV